MTPGKINRRVLVDRLAWIDRMLEEIEKLPLRSYESFMQDSRNIWAAESCLRRSLEALMDLGRHILAKGFGIGITEHKQIAQELERAGVLSSDDASLFKILAGYRNRIVHFYHEVGSKELYTICRDETQDRHHLKEALIRWIEANPGRMDETL